MPWTEPKRVGELTPAVPKPSRIVARTVPTDSRWHVLASAGDICSVTGGVRKDAATVFVWEATDVISVRRLVRLFRTDEDINYRALSLLHHGVCIISGEHFHLVEHLAPWPTRWEEKRDDR